MRLLLDSQVVIWRWVHDRRLSGQMRELISDPDNDVYASAATVWELEIKHAKGRMTLPGRVIEVSIS